MRNANKLFDIYDEILKKQRLLEVPFPRADEFLGDIWEMVERYIVTEVFNKAQTDSENELFFEYYSGNLTRKELIAALTEPK